MEKKGFTLIELLAVILVLGIIALIAIPLVNNIIKDSKKKALGVDCRTIYNAVEEYKELAGLLNDYDPSKCVYFEFGNSRTLREELNGNIYEPISELNLHNINYNSGYASLCGDAITVFVNNTSNTCLVTNNSEAILEGSVSDNDITDPVLNDITLTAKSNAILVSVDATETDGIVEKYFYKIDGGSFVESNLPTHVFSGLQKESTHTVTVYVENRSGLKSSELTKSETTLSVSMPMAVVTQIPTDTEYATSKKAIVNFNTNLTHFIKSSVAGSVNVSLEECGTGSNPGTCTSASITSLLPNTWYKVNGSNIEVTYVSDGTLTAKEYDGTNYSEEKEVVIDKIDTVVPVISKTQTGKVVDITITDNIGLTKYGVGTSNTDEPAYEDITGTSVLKTYTAASAGTYYIWVKDKANNISIEQFTVDISAFSYAATSSSYAAEKYCSSSTRGCYCSCGGYNGVGHCGWHVEQGESVSWVTNCSAYSYRCNNGGTLSGTNCVTYSCPDGGTLNTTTNMCER